MIWGNSESENCSVVSDSLQPHRPSPWNSLGQNTGVGSLSLPQGIFPTQESNLGLPHWGWILYQLTHEGKPKNTGVGSLSLLQWIFLTQELNWGLLHCRWILYQLRYQGSSTSRLSMKNISWQCKCIKVKVNVTLSCVTLCDPMDYTVHGILQAWILEWIAISFSRGFSQPRDQTQVSCTAGGFFTSWATREAQEYWIG